MIFAVQCDELVTTDQLEDPTGVTPENVDPDFMLNSIQNNTQQFYNSTSNMAGEMARMHHMFGRTYQDAYTPENFNTVYQSAYADLLIDTQNIQPVAEEQELYFHLGIAKVLQAYGMITLVDMFGPVPWDEALDEDAFEPDLSDDEGIYQEALDLLDEAIDDLQNEDRAAFPEFDLMYPELSGGALVDAWVRVANTIKFKSYLNMGDEQGMEDMLDEPLITDPDHDFTFEFSTSDTDPDARHPSFSANYVGATSTFLSVAYMGMLLNDKDDFGVDPRMRYYFYRQTNVDSDDPNELTCDNEAVPGHFDSDDPWCQLGDGYWGWNHLIDSGIPPEADLRTTYGVYPAGGEFDADQPTLQETRAIPTSDDMGLQGAGFHPMLMSFYTYFMKAEAAEVYGVGNQSAQDYLAEAVELSLNTVREFGAPLASEAAGGAFEMTDDDIDAYLDEVMDNYSEEGALRTIAKEYYLALWPNGVEAYNSMRRTHYPNQEDNLQPTQTSDPGDWYRSFPYSANLIDRNQNVGPKDSRLEGPFWDENRWQGADREAFNF